MSVDPERLARLTKDILDGTMQDLYVEDNRGFQIHPNYVNPNRLGPGLDQAIASPWDTRVATLAAYTLRWVGFVDRNVDDYDPEAIVPKLYDISREHVTFGDLEVPKSLKVLQLMGLAEVDEESVKSTVESRTIMSRNPDQTPTILPPKGRLFHGFTRAAKVNRLYTKLIYGNEATLQEGKATMSSETYARRRNMRVVRPKQDE
jgi:hypothetical protein